MATYEFGTKNTRIRALLLFCLWTSALLVAGCLGRYGSGASSEPDLLATLPDDWVPVDNGDIWHQIDIDNDLGVVEYLLFFTYNNRQAGTASGPSGALIYDLQDNGDLMPNDLPYQPSGSYIPYRPLPNYWKESGTGFVAPTGNHGQIISTEAVRSGTNQVREIEERLVDEAGVTEIITGTAPVKELLVEDGGNTVTVIWWRNIVDGYGAASVYANGGIKDQQYVTQGDKTSSLVSFVGLHPFDDRSEVCAMTLYARQYITNSNSIGEGNPEGETLDVRFSGTPHGIDFCAGAPALPFYPEGVVLGYLMGGSSNSPLVEFSDVDYTEMAGSLITGLQNGELRIGGIFGPPLIPPMPKNSEPDKRSKATVCVELIDDKGQQSAYNFFLRHVKPDISNSTTDEFRIYDLRKIPAPEDGLSAYCSREIVEDGTPGRDPKP